MKVKKLFDNAILPTKAHAGDLGYDLYATWCKPCQEMLPVIEEISNTNDIPFYKVDIDEVPDAKTFTGAKAVPMLYIYKDGRIREFAFGVNDKSKIEMKLKRVMRA